MAQKISCISKTALEELREKNPFISNIELVYRLVRDDIVACRLKPGQKINQELIADKLGMSRSPVREALLQLEADGFLAKGVQGYTVYIMKIGDYMALLDLRTAYEELAARLSCSRIRFSEMKDIERNLLETKKYLELGMSTAWDDNFEITDPERAESLLYELGQKDQEFHSMIVKSSHNRYLINDYERLKPMIHFFRHSALDVNACLNMLDRHKAIYSAITSRDETLAVSRMQTHLALTVSRAMRY